MKVIWFVDVDDDRVLEEYLDVDPEEDIDYAVNETFHAAVKYGWRHDEFAETELKT